MQLVESTIYMHCYTLIRVQQVPELFAETIHFLMQLPVHNTCDYESLFWLQIKRKKKRKKKKDTNSGSHIKQLGQFWVTVGIVPL